MKYLFVLLAGVILALSIVEFPTIISLAVDHQMAKSQKKNCHNKGIDRKDCHFNLYFDDYKENNQILNKIDSYFLPNQDTLYFVLSGRCTNQIFYNPSASKDSGKITRREYFGVSCMSRFAQTFSDLIYGDK